MKRLLQSFIIAMLMVGGLALQASAQDLIVESSCSHPILVHVDGICMNAVPQQSVVVDRLDPGIHDIEVEIIRDRSFHNRGHRHGVRHGTDVLFTSSTLVTRRGRTYILQANVSPCGTFASLDLVHEGFNYLDRSGRFDRRPVGRTLQGRQGPAGRRGYGRAGYGGNPHRYGRPSGRVQGPQGRGINQRGLLNIQQLLIVLDDTPFDSDRLDVAQLALSQSRGLFTQDVLRIMDEFSFDRNRLAFAKMAFQYTIDKENFYTLNQGLTFASSRRDLNRFLATV